MLFLTTFGENKGLIFGVRSRTRLVGFWDAFWSFFGIFLDSFGSLGATFGRLLVKWTPKWSILARDVFVFCFGPFFLFPPRGSLFEGFWHPFGYFCWLLIYFWRGSGILSNILKRGQGRAQRGRRADDSVEALRFRRLPLLEDFLCLLLSCSLALSPFLCSFSLSLFLSLHLLAFSFKIETRFLFLC